MRCRGLLIAGVLALSGCGIAAAAHAQVPFKEPDRANEAHRARVPSRRLT